MITIGTVGDKCHQKRYESRAPVGKREAGFDDTATAAAPPTRSEYGRLNISSGSLCKSKGLLIRLRLTLVGT